MDISALCDKLNLQPPVKDRILSFSDQFDFQRVDALQKDYFVFEKMADALAQTRAQLGEDPEGMGILTCMLRVALDAHRVYQQMGIPEEIYFATMGCFPRFLGETRRMTGNFSFDRCWWTTRQVGCHLYRIGALEYEIRPADGGVFIDLHIPSDADLSPAAVTESLREAGSFFEKFYPSLAGCEYRCHSWLLDPQLKAMLGENSNIVAFQNRFEITGDGEVSTGVLQWLFRTRSTDYSTLPEATSLQRNVKKHLLSGGVIRNAFGRLKRIP